MYSIQMLHIFKESCDVSNQKNIFSGVYFPLCVVQVDKILIYIITDDSGDESKERTEEVKGNWLIRIFIFISLCNYLYLLCV